jgi:hypothetical protein
VSIFDYFDLFLVWLIISTLILNPTIMKKHFISLTKFLLLAFLLTLVNKAYSQSCTSYAFADGTTITLHPGCKNSEYCAIITNNSPDCNWTITGLPVGLSASRSLDCLSDTIYGIISISNGSSSIIIVTIKVGFVNQTMTCNLQMYDSPVPTSSFLAPTCIGKSLSLTGGPAGLSYSWTSNSIPVFTSNLQSPIITSSAYPFNNGRYTLTVTDANGCSASSYVDVVIHDLPVITPAVTNPVCNGDLGSISLSVTGSSPYTYNWKKDDVAFPSTASSVTGLSPGIYLAKVTDGNGCESSMTMNIIEPPVLIIGAVSSNTSSATTNDGKIDITANGGVKPYTYTCSNGSSGSLDAAGKATLSGLAPNNYNITVTDWKGCARTASAKIRAPFDLMFVLDQSGSMADIPGGYSVSKWNQLKNDMSTLFSLFSLFNTANASDRMGVAYFSDNAAVYTIASQKIFGYSTGTITNLQNDIASRSPLNCTSIGGGLQAAIDVMRTSANQKYILLLTDGMQNHNPMLSDASPYTIQNSGTGTWCNTGTPYPVPATPDAIASSAIKVYTIALGDSPDNYYTLLEAMSLSTAPLSFFNPKTGTFEQKQAFIETFVNMFSGNSPQLIDFRTGKTAANRTVQTFKCNSNVDKIVFILNKQEGSNLSFSIQKNNINIPGQVVNNGSTMMIAVQLPLVVNGQNISPEGDWNMLVSGTANTDYAASAIADDHHFKYNCSLSNNSIRTGQQLIFNANLVKDGASVSNAKVTAYIYKPGADLGTLMSNYSVSKVQMNRAKILTADKDFIKNLKLQNPTVYNDFNSEADIKRSILLRDKGIIEKLRSLENKVELQYKNGAYTGSFKSTEVTGTYKIVFHIEYTDGTNSTIVRMQTNYAFVEFGELNLPGSDIVLIPADDLLHKPWQSVIRPVDNNGNLIGPGHSNQINVSVSGIDPVKTIDNLDGSYTLVYDKKLEATDKIKVIINKRNFNVKKEMIKPVDTKIIKYIRQ